MIIFSFIISVLLSQVPIGYKLSIDKTLNRYENITENNSWPENFLANKNLGVITNPVQSYADGSAYSLSLE